MFKNENGFSLVELAIAAGLAVALAATAVTILSGTTASLSSKANGAAGTSSTYNSDVLANASGAASGNTGGNNNGGNNNASGVTFTKGVEFGGGSYTTDGNTGAPIIYLNNINGTPDFNLAAGKTVSFSGTYFDSNLAGNMGVDPNVPFTGTATISSWTTSSGGMGGNELYIYLENVNAISVGQVTSITIG